MFTKKRADKVTPGRRNNRAVIGAAIAILLPLALLAIGGVALTTTHLFGVGAQAPVKGLAGQQTWQRGTSSLLFGANDASWRWSTQNLGNAPAIVNAVKTAGVTVIRSP